MEYKPERYNDKINRIHHQNGTRLKVSNQVSGQIVWDGPAKSSLTLAALAQILRCCGDEVIFFFIATPEAENGIEIPATRFGQTIKLLLTEVAEPDQPDHPKVLQLLYRREAGTDRGLLQATEMGETQSMEICLAEMKKSLTRQQVREFCTKCLFVASKQGHSQKVNLLLAKGADIKKHDKDGNTALHVAARKGHTEVGLILINNGVDKDKPNLAGDTALLVAAANGKSSVVNILLEHMQTGALETKDLGGHTALLLAARVGSSQTVTLLVSKRACIHATNQDGDTALMLATRAQHDDVIVELLKWGAEANGANKWGYTSLHMAVEVGATSTARLLLDQGASPDPGGDSPLVLALQGLHTDVVKLLVERDANVNAMNTDGMTPLLQSTILGQTDLVKLLVEKQADMTGKLGFNAQLGARHGRAETTQFVTGPRDVGSEIGRMGRRGEGFSEDQWCEENRKENTREWAQESRQIAESEAEGSPGQR